MQKYSILEINVIFTHFSEVINHSHLLFPVMLFFLKDLFIYFREEESGGGAEGERENPPKETPH